MERARQAENATQPSETIQRKGALCRALRLLGMDAAPHLAAWDELLDRHSDEEILAAARHATGKRPGQRLHLNYLVPLLADRKAPQTKRESPWWASDESILAKAKALGLAARPGESWAELRARISAALDARQEQAA